MKRYLDYTLDTGVDGQLKFQILYQSPKVNKFFDFLKSIGKDTYLTKSGYKVARSVFPEFKISRNTIFLRGALKSLDNKVDVTRFVNNGTYRKGSMSMFNDALKEFVNEVKRADENGLLDNYSVSYLNDDYSDRVERENPLAKLNITGFPNTRSLSSLFRSPSIATKYMCFPTETVTIKPVSKPCTPSRNVTYIYL